MGSSSKKRNRGGRPKTRRPKIKQFNFRINEEDWGLIVRAADGYPPTTWARVELLRLARTVVERQKKGAR